MRNAFLSELTELAEQDSRIWLLCGDLGYSVLESFAARFPNRFLNLGVAEQNMAGAAAGLALSGKTVFIYSIGNFVTLRCLEQIRNDICYHGADVKIVAVGAGYSYGAQGYTHHLIEDLAIMSAMPAMDVLAPCDPVEARLATRAIARSGKPAYLRLARAGEPALHAEAPLDLEQPLTLRDGGDVWLLACGTIAQECLAAAELLAQIGVSVRVSSVPRLKPFDARPVADAVQRFRLVATAEDHILHGGLHAAVARCFASHSRRPPLVGLGIPDAMAATRVAGSREALLERVGLSAGQIAERLHAALKSGVASP